VAGTAIAALLLAASPALAAQRFAASTGSGTACSSGSPCTIQQAFTGAGTGDEIVIAPGDYAVAATLFLPLNGFAHGVQGQPAPRIHFAATHYIHTGNPGARLSYVQIDGPTSAPLEVDQNTQADQVYVHATGGDACLVYGTLIDSVCWASAASGEAVSGAATSTYTPVLRNVTAEATASGGVGVEYHTSAPGSIIVTAVNLIAHGTSQDLKVQADAPANATINIDHSNFVSGSGSGTGAHINATAHQTAAPLFVNAAAGDFNEIPGSPTIDAGVTSAANGPFDLIGRPRVINGATDIGAAEYDPFNGVTLRGGKVHVKKGKAPVSIGCPTGIPTPCAGTLTLSYRHGSKTSTAGKASFSIAAGVTQKVKVKLKKPAFRRVEGRGKLKVSAFADATDGAGTSAGTSGKVKLRA
jgi:hypothetical protein